MDRQPPAPPSRRALARGPMGAPLLHMGCKGCLAHCVMEQRVRPLPACTPAGSQLVKETGQVCSAGCRCLPLPKQSVIQTSG